MTWFGGNAHGPDSYSLAEGMLSSSNLLFAAHLVPKGETNAAAIPETNPDHLAKPAWDAEAASMMTKPKASQLGGLAYLARVGNDLDALVPPLAGDSRVRILQRPRIQTSDGEPATMFVGELRPHPTSTYYGGGACGPSSISQLQTGVTLDVTPSIKPNGFVMLEIHQKIDRVTGSVTISNVGDVPITSSTEAQAKVVVRDRGTILFGGLIERDATRTPSGVPLLKDIPLLGALFRSSSARTERNEILVLIRTTILSSSETATAPPKVKNNEQTESKL